MASCFSIHTLRTQSLSVKGLKGKRNESENRIEEVSVRWPLVFGFTVAPLYQFLIFQWEQTVKNKSGKRKKNKFALELGFPQGSASLSIDW